ncbi:hypothetical protein BBP40_006397 [Aspergillus hancockii]|nr:hypothetical protein BBP40_006397 [Aspergillus hancockii]
MKPTVVLVPGAWLVPDFYKPFLDIIQAAGFPTCVTELPSLDPVDPTTSDCSTDAASIRHDLSVLVEGGRDVVLVMHSYAVPEGISCAGTQGGNLPSWILLDQPSGHLNVPDTPGKIFAADVSEEEALAMTSFTKPHASLAFFSAQPFSAWSDPAFTGRLAYIVTTEDLAVPKAAQYGMMAGTGQEWAVREIASSHCAPYISRITESVRILEELIQMFENI